MTKRLTKRQANAKRLAAQQEEAARIKLLRAVAPSSTKEISLHQIPKYEYDDKSKARSIPSATAVAAPTRIEIDYTETPELAAREALAQREKDRKRKRLAPAYNKGPIMYITDGMDPAELGRKL